MTRNKPVEQSQLDALIHRRAGVVTAIRELEDYLVWRRKHPLWGRWKRDARASAGPRRGSGKADPG